MAKEKGSVAVSGMGLPGWLLLLFIGLKLTGYINWSWWWVMSPLLIPVGLVGVVAVGAAIIYLLEEN